MNKKQRLFFSRNPPVLSSFLLKIHPNKSGIRALLLSPYTLHSILSVTHYRGNTRQDERGVPR